MEAIHIWVPGFAICSTSSADVGLHFGQDLISVVRFGRPPWTSLGFHNHCPTEKDGHRSLGMPRRSGTAQSGPSAITTQHGGASVDSRAREH